MVGLDSTIIMHPQIWKCSGHYDLFHDFMVDCRESKKCYRHDQVRGRWVGYQGQVRLCRHAIGGAEGLAETEQRALKFYGLCQGRRTTRLGRGLISLTKVPDFADVSGGCQGTWHAH